MFEYEYVTVKIKQKIFTSECTEHREIINKYAQKGYRYAGFIPTLMASYGQFNEIDLIFEIQK